MLKKDIYLMTHKPHKKPKPAVRVVDESVKLVCSKCKELKENSDFYAKYTRYGIKVRESLCKQCRKSHVSEYENSHPEAVRRYAENKRKRAKENLTDVYVRQTLKWLGISNPTPEMIEIRRSQILAKRMAKELSKLKDMVESDPNYKTALKEKLDRRKAENKAKRLRKALERARNAYKPHPRVSNRPAVSGASYLCAGCKRVKDVSAFKIKKSKRKGGGVSYCLSLCRECANMKYTYKKRRIKCELNRDVISGEQCADGSNDEVAGRQR